MKPKPKPRTLVIVGLMAAAAAAATAEQNPLERAKDLYASAAYEEALSTLSHVTDAVAGTPAVQRQVDEYRAFCLYALGRNGEAESVAESIIRREPLAQLDAADASPRLEAMFVSVQKRILPGLIRDQYRKLRSLLDQKQFAAAEPGLAETRRMLNEAERLGAMDEGLGDLGVLIDGFLALSHARGEMRSSAAPTPAAPAAPAAMPAVVAAAIEPPAAAPSEGRPDLSAARNKPRVYSVEDADVLPPVAIYQREPSVPVELMTILRASHKPTIMSLTIDETGAVRKAEVRVSVNRRYDTLLTHAAVQWKYRPAVRDAAPVPYEKLVVVEVK